MQTLIEECVRLERLGETNKNKVSNLEIAISFRNKFYQKKLFLVRHSNNISKQLFQSKEFLTSPLVRLHWIATNFIILSSFPQLAFQCAFHAIFYYSFSLNYDSYADPEKGNVRAEEIFTSPFLHKKSISVICLWINYEQIIKYSESVCDILHFGEAFQALCVCELNRGKIKKKTVVTSQIDCLCRSASDAVSPCS